MGITWVDLSGSIVALRTAGTGRKRGVQGGQGEPPGRVALARQRAAAQTSG
jgi:hypothetical protein